MPRQLGQQRSTDRTCQLYARHIFFSFLRDIPNAIWGMVAGEGQPNGFWNRPMVIKELIDMCDYMHILIVHYSE